MTEKLIGQVQQSSLPVTAVFRSKSNLFREVIIEKDGDEFKLSAIWKTKPIKITAPYLQSGSLVTVEEANVAIREREQNQTNHL